MLADAQGGYFSAAQARAYGYGYRLQHYHVAAGNWFRVGRATFRLRVYPTHQWEDLVRVSFWALQRGVVSHESALSVHDLGETIPDRVHLIVPPGFRKRDAAVVLHTGQVNEEDVESRPGFRITAPLRSLLDCAEDALVQEQFTVAVQGGLKAGIPLYRLEDRARGLTPYGRQRLERALRVAAVRRVYREILKR